MRDPTEIIEEQLEADGISSVRVKDGRLWFFKTELLEKLLAEAKDGDRVCLFVVDGNPEAKA